MVMMIKKNVFIPMCMTLLVTITGCATYDPKVGMTYRQFDSMNGLSFNGAPVFIEQWNGSDIYQQYDAVRLKEKGEKISNDLDRYYYFKDKKLVAIKSKDEYLSDKNINAYGLTIFSQKAPKTEQEIRQRMNVIEATLKSNFSNTDRWDDWKQEWIVPPVKQSLINEFRALNDNLNRINDEKRKAAQSQEEQKRNADSRIANQKAQQAREQCLSNGQIGICQSSSQNNVQFLCDQNAFVAFDNIFNQYCYVTDNFHITSKMEVRNNLNKSIKDITFTCTQYAKSGTILGSNVSTIYDIWNVNQSKVINLKFFKQQQVASMNCRVSNYK